MIELEQYVVIYHENFSPIFYLIRCTLRSDIRAVGQSPSPENRAWIQDRRESLQRRIEVFHQQALQFIHGDVASVSLSLSRRVPGAVEFDLEDSDDEGFFLDEQAEWEDEGDLEIPIEQVRIQLPSSFAESERVQMGLVQVAEVEAELREGQANDALEALRAGLAEKSLRFRTEVRPAKSHRTMTRAWDSIHKADKQIQGAVQYYQIARNALEGLGVSSELLDRYQEIQKKDLKMSGDIVEENRVGQRSSKLPWFWRLDRKWDKDRGEFLRECECLFFWLYLETGSTLLFKFTE